jgi:hypothetical protein
MRATEPTYQLVVMTSCRYATVIASNHGHPRQENHSETC